LGGVVELGELLVGRVVADGEAFEHAEPALSFGFGDAGGEVFTDADEPRLVSEVAGRSIGQRMRSSELHFSRSSFCGSSGGGGERRHAKIGRDRLTTERGFDLSEFVFGAAVADVESFDFAEPALLLGLDDAGFEVVADFFQPGALRRVRSQERASHTGVLVNAG
jgi:hypothetical protein